MLETKNLVKIYKPKKGVPVKALDDVSLLFPQKGMVFLLGKSGSGKSTLLNVLGGLDKYDGGEIIIKGVSSKAFKQKHFDSYRNTYVGFIFQEYNVLDDFSVGANIALAIELQNRKATDDEVNAILKEVDLEGYGNRKPNELSGGQKQRVAIARALVKNPEIIMADEPTGALDSNTGKQIFDTLKKLSANKLVIVVSHDRDFAENYADRIIELSDGKVISDVETSCESTETAGIEYKGNTVEIPLDYHITEEDRMAINEYKDSLKSGVLKLDFKTFESKKFVNTDTAKIQKSDSSAFKLIKSKLPLKNALKIGAGALKYKKFRLVMTILLSCIAFGLFGLADTFGAYNHINTCTNSLYDTGFKYIATAKSKKVGNDDYSYWRDYGYHISDKDIEIIEKNTALKMQGVYEPINSELSFSGNLDDTVALTQTDFDIYRKYFNGYAEISDEIIENMGFNILAGSLPDGEKDEIAVSEYIFEIFKKAGYTDGKLVKQVDGTEKPVYQTINHYSDLLGKTLNIDKKKLIITAVIDTNFNMERYISLIKEDTHKSRSQRIFDYVLASECNYAVDYSYSDIIMTGKGFIEKMISTRPSISNITEGYITLGNEECNVDPNYLALLSNIDKKAIKWTSGEKTSLSDKEIIVSQNAFYLFDEGDLTDDEMIERLKKLKPLTARLNFFANDESIEDGGYKIVGIIKNNTEFESTVICSDSLYYKLAEPTENYYRFTVGSMPKTKKEIKDVVGFCYREDSNVRYQIQNSVTYELDAINEELKAFSKAFLYIGIAFAVFAALMLSNFIATSITYKKQEIGILRAIGSRSNDVFRIFFAESFIIAMINFLLSAVGVGVVTALVNYYLRQELGILITVLNFSVRQVLLLLAVSIFVAAVASYLPVKRIASKRPIDAIRDR